MPHKVSALGKAFGGLFAAIVLIAWFAFSTRERDAELRLVHEQDPWEYAKESFLRGDRAFYLSWRYRFASNAPSGSWELPGQEDIPAALLLRFPERRRIERSWHMDLAKEASRFARESWRWAADYNRRMAALISNVDRDPAHASQQ